MMFSAVLRSLCTLPKGLQGGEHDEVASCSDPLHAGQLLHLRQLLPAGIHRLQA